MQKIKFRFFIARRRSEVGGDVNWPVCADMDGCRGSQLRGEECANDLYQIDATRRKQIGYTAMRTTHNEQSMFCYF